VWNVDVPDRPEYDAIAEQRAMQDARIMSRMNRAVFLSDVAERFAEAIRESDTPLEELCTMMFEAPIRDLYDHRAFLGSQLRDAKKLGAAIMRIVADVSLQHFQGAADDEPF
jgi:hypothetical protein